ncbi:receptor activity-modifying protein 2 isoform X3 [Eleginops maclovinus]|uniref:receptor activity-modifying protein 2 isoform X3 n=1 Tax=Eleginops maclovinus TaxID=56733 RepID=UPI003080B48A
MRASCYFIESSCRKVEICNPYPPGKTDRALSGKMTATSFSLMFSGCFVTLLILGGCTSVVCLVDEKLAVQPATTIGTCTVRKQKSYITTTTWTNMTPFLYRLLLKRGDSCQCYSWRPYIAICTNRCTWGNVSNFYSNLSLCTEEISDCLLIPWPNQLVEQTFVNIHSRFFKDCPSEALSDPPPVIVLALVITPICLIPLMVSLVVLKTKNGDGSS